VTEVQVENSYEQEQNSNLGKDGSSLREYGTRGKWMNGQIHSGDLIC